MIEKTIGSILVEGKELEDDVGEARRKMGLCTQKDVLYDDMTVADHLHYIASIKGMTSTRKDQEVEKILNEVGI